MSNPIDRFLSAIESASIPQAGAFAADAELDATVPNWRWTTRGGTNVENDLSNWFADLGRFEEIKRTPIGDGELVEFVLFWEENGVPHSCHQAHILTVRDGLIIRDVAFCGGRWPAGLMAEMEEAALANA